ncbi:MAG: SIMPL domain-containing protein [Christensenella sp.]|nr:SIMPL domain-containing protein [Christensenella sp.]
MEKTNTAFGRTIRFVTGAMLILALAFTLAGCKEEGDIVPGPTAKPEQPTVIVNNEAAIPERSIHVSGMGEVIAAPDFATIHIVAMGSSATSEEAAANCETVTQQVKEIAGAQGVLTKNLTTSGVTLSSSTRESDGAITGYVARDTITIIESDINRVNAILSPIIDARITESYEVTYSLLDASAAYSSALAAAMADAQEKAAAIAAAGGVILGGILSVSESPIESQLAGVAFKSSSIAVDAAVTVTYQISAAQPQN